MSRKYTSCFLKIAKIFVFLKTPTPGYRETKVLRIYIAGEKRTSYELSPPKWYKEEGFLLGNPRLTEKNHRRQSRNRPGGERVKSGSGQKEQTGFVKEVYFLLG